MGARADALAKQVEQASQSLVDTCGRLTDGDWRKTTSAEKWSVGVVAHHVAMGHANIGKLLKTVASGQAVPHLTMAMLDERNAKHAREYANCTKTETLALHKENAAAAAGLIRGLSDAELDRSGTVLAGIPAMTAQQVVERILINHVNEHLGSIRATTGVK